MSIGSPLPSRPSRPRNLAIASAFVGAIGLAVFAAASPRAQADAPKAIASPSSAAKAIAATPTSPPEDEYVYVYCRGPFLLSGGGLLGIRGRNSAKGAGEWADDLKPSECALGDRTFKGGERAEVRFHYPDNPSKVAGVAATLGACAMDSDCIAQARVKVDDNGYWHAAANEAVRIWKHGFRPS